MGIQRVRPGRFQVFFVLSLVRNTGRHFYFFAGHFDRGKARAGSCHLQSSSKERQK